MYGSSYMNHTVKDGVFLVIWGDQVIYFIEVGLEHRTKIYRNTGGGGGGREKFYPGRDSPVSRKRALTVLVPLMTARTSTRVFL